MLVTMELEPAGRWVADYYPCETVEEVGSDRLLISLRVADPRWIRRLCLRLAPGGSWIRRISPTPSTDANAALDAYARADRPVVAG